MKIAVLAVQGAFIEHEKALQRLGAETVELRKAEDLEQDLMALFCRAAKVPYRADF